MKSPDKSTPLILASASPRRIELLRMLGARFSVIPSGIEEETGEGALVADIVERNALAKASDVARRLGRGLVVGADTVVVLDGKVFGKPADLDDARRMLGLLAGKTHSVYSGVAVVRAEDDRVETADDRSARQGGGLCRSGRRRSHN